GLYSAAALTEIKGRKIVSASQPFFVRPFTPEASPRPANIDLLKALARASQGQFCEPAELTEVLGGLTFQGAEEERVGYTNLWNTLTILACLAGLLSLEWLVRKLNNLP
ncbi:hypothetical protein HQ590_16220, partial [bacterium]|nr:hypothetical protein [bacterium]